LIKVCIGYIKELLKGGRKLPTINVSFKNTKKELALYNLVKSKEEQSEFIKKTIEFYLKSKKQSLPKKDRLIL